MVDCLGLSQESCVLEEKVQDRVLRLLDLREGSIQSFPLSLKPKGLPPPEVLLRHQDLFAAPRNEKKKGLADEVLPNPWNFLVTEKIPLRSEINILDTGKKEELQKLRVRFEELEKVMSSFELTFWMVESLQLTFVFHFVRGQLHQTGMISSAFFEEIQKRLGPITYRVAKLSEQRKGQHSGFSFCFQQLQSFQDEFEMKL